MNTLCIDIGGTSIKMALIDSNGEFICDYEKPSLAEQGANIMMEKLIEYIKINITLPFNSIGISSAGQINPNIGVVTYATDTIRGYTDFNIKDFFESHFKIPVVVENDVNACAIGEAVYGAGKSYINFICLTVGTGIGGAIFLDKKIMYGNNFAAGEFGHMITHPGGRECTCGKKGCYEQYASTNALVKTIYEKTGKKMDGRKIFQCIDEPIIKNIVDEWIMEIVYGLVSLNYIFNPPAIIIGGGIMEQPYITFKIAEIMPSMMMKNYQSVKILSAALGNKAALMGMYYKTLNIKNPL